MNRFFPVLLNYQANIMLRSSNTIFALKQKKTPNTMPLTSHILSIQYHPFPVLLLKTITSYQTPALSWPQPHPTHYSRAHFPQPHKPHRSRTTTPFSFLSLRHPAAHVSLSPATCKTKRPQAHNIYEASPRVSINRAMWHAHMDSHMVREHHVEARRYIPYSLSLCVSVRCPPLFSLCAYSSVLARRMGCVARESDRKERQSKTRHVRL